MNGSKQDIYQQDGECQGWLATQGSFDAVSEKFGYTAIHSYLNDNIKVNNKIFKGESSIHNDESVTIIDNTIYFQSHIWGEYKCTLIIRYI